jgi:hypothetical protein
MSMAMNWIVMGRVGFEVLVGYRQCESSAEMTEMLYAGAVNLLSDIPMYCICVVPMDKSVVDEITRKSRRLCLSIRTEARPSHVV